MIGGAGSPFRRVRTYVPLVALLAVFAAYTSTHVRAAALLLRFSATEAPSGFSRFRLSEVSEETSTLAIDSGSTRVRYYVPVGVTEPPGIVLCHGVHHLGIDEPRLQRFARAIAGAGVLVMTPELSELADYRVDIRSIDTISSAAKALGKRIGRQRVGVMGMSFAGGLSLIAASDDRTRAPIAFVVAVGAHDDLVRVSNFFIKNEIERPNGDKVQLHAHGYGLLVVAYTHAEDLFVASELATAREVLRLWLWGERDQSRRLMSTLSPASVDMLGRLLSERSESVSAEILGLIAKYEPAMRAVSPHNHLGGVRVPVYLLHGAGDTVIPATETEWLAADAPHEWVRNALISQAIEHVELQGKPRAREQWELVHWMAGVLSEASDAR